jgi:hypothetical protein
MMGRQNVDQSQLFYLFNLEGRIPSHFKDVAQHVQISCPPYNYRVTDSKLVRNCAPARRHLPHKLTSQ